MAHIDKLYMENACSSAGLKPAKRETYKNMEIFIADGYCEKPEIKLQKFGPPENYPLGCYATVWFIADHNDAVRIGACLFEQPIEPYEISLNNETKTKMRVKTALTDAKAAADIIAEKPEIMN